MEHFAAEAKLVIDAFWDRVDTGGRDIHNATLFKKGEEMFISGPPGMIHEGRISFPTI